jgi:hypothetical protein
LVVELVEVLEEGPMAGCDLSYSPSLKASGNGQRCLGRKERGRCIPDGIEPFQRDRLVRLAGVEEKVEKVVVIKVAITVCATGQLSCESDLCA